ncbi:MAG: transcriptional regulator protein [Sphingobium sp.]|nr:MAG: transcriptional regulator protein [Sphingobium sp.]
MEEAFELTGLRDPVAMRLGYRLRRASAAMMADLGAHLAAIGLRPVEATILILVGANPRCIQSDLGRVLGIKRANMAPLIATLTGRGLIEKSPVDGRSLALTLTLQGEAKRDKAECIMDEREAHFGALLSGQDTDALHAALSIIAQDAKEED